MDLEARQIYSSKEKVLDLYNKKLENNDRISQSNKDIIRLWQNSLFAKGSKQYRIGKLTLQILRLLELTDYKELTTLTILEVEDLLASIERVPNWSDASKTDHRRCIKQFYNWYEDHDTLLEEGDKTRIKFYRYLRKNVHTSYKTKIVDYSSIITEKDISIVLQKGCNNARDKAFLSTLFEGGFRIGELLNMRIKDLEFNNNACTIQVDGKTGRRRVPLKVLAPGYLQRWLRDHPYSDDENAYLWISFATNFKNKNLNYRGASKICERAFDQAKVRKKCNPHWFRHSAGTRNAKFMSESMLCLFFGWVMGSDQPRTYVHAGTQQVEDVLNKHYGLVAEDKKDPLVICHLCETVNTQDATYCSKCGQPLTQKAFETRDETINFAFKLMEKIAKDPELSQKFEEFKRKV